MHTVCILLLVLAFLTLPTNVEAANTDIRVTKIEDADLNIPALIKVLNDDRVANGLYPLRRNETLDAAAALKAADMAREQYFAHTSPAGINPWHWFRLVDYNYIYAGENLALDFADAPSVQKAWMESPKHRANILSRDYEEVGYAISKGTFTNINSVKKTRSNVVVIVQLFGKRIPVAATAEPILSPAIPSGSRTVTNVAEMGNVINNLSAKLLSQNLSHSNNTLGAAAENANTSPASLPILAFGLAMLMTTAGFHSKLMV